MTDFTVSSSNVGNIAVSSTSSGSFISSVVSGVTVAVCVTVSYITPISQSASPTAEVKLPVNNILPPITTPELPAAPPMFTAPNIPSVSGMLQSFQGLPPIISINVTVQKAPTEVQNIPAPAPANVQNPSTQNATTGASNPAPLPPGLAQELKAFAENNNLPPEATVELEKGVTSAMQDAAKQMQPGGNPEGQPQSNSQNNPTNESPESGAAPAGGPPPPGAPPPPGMMMDNMPQGGMPQFGEMPSMPAGEMPAFALPSMPNMPAMPEGLASAFNAIQGIPVLPPGIGSVPVLPVLPPNFDFAAFQDFINNLPPPPDGFIPPPIVP